uniref:Uncharacterized protein n=1 Tax=Rhizophora mucronata TaxID=61149 RepID=A0A2P2QMY9_RHIMU
MGIYYQGVSLGTKIHDIEKPMRKICKGTRAMIDYSKELLVRYECSLEWLRQLFGLGTCFLHYENFHMFIFFYKQKQKLHWQKFMISSLAKLFLL